jgi:hypothetical protein
VKLRLGQLTILAGALDKSAKNMSRLPVENEYAKELNLL